LAPQNPANRRADLRGVQHGRRYLVEERLKEVVIRAIDQNYPHRCLSEGLGGREASKTSSDDHDTWDTLTHGSP